MEQPKNMNRTKEQALGEWAESFLATELMRVGWLAEKLQHDYGLDLLVQPIRECRVVANLALVQVKGIATRPSCPDAYSIRIKTRHLQLWSEISLPIFLAIVYRDPESAYLINFHKSLPVPRQELPAQKSWSLRFSEGNRLNARLAGEMAEAIRGRYEEIRATLVKSHPWLEGYATKEDESRTLQMLAEIATGSASAAPWIKAMLLLELELDDWELRKSKRYRNVVNSLGGWWSFHRHPRG